MRPFILIFAALSSSMAVAQKTSYPAQRLNAAGITEIRVSGVKGKLVLKARASKTYAIKVNHSKGKKGEDWHLSVDRQHSALVLEVFSTEYGREWRNQVRRELWPEFDVEIEGPAQPATLAWREGAIEVHAWSSPLEVSFLKGPFTARDMRARLKVQAVDSDVKVTGHRGELEIKGESGEVALSDVQGPIKLQWLRGTATLEKAAGRVDIDHGGGVLRALGGSGTWNVKMARGKADFANFKGRLKGEGDSLWTVSASAPSEVEVLGGSQNVVMNWLSGGVKLFLSTKRGSIDAPAAKPVELRGGIRVVEADFEPKPKGQVFLRTESGKIKWRR